MQPLLVMVIAGIVGGVIAAVYFTRTRRRWLVGGALGAVGAALGSQMFIAPLEYCTFEPNRPALDQTIGVVLIAIGAASISGLLIWGANRMRGGWRELFTADSQPGAFKGWLMPILLMLPTLAILLLFLYYPALDTLHLSTQTSFLGIPGTIPVCVDNFTMLMRDSGYGRAMSNTALISIATVVLSMGLALAIATMAYQPVKGARIYRTLLIWPYAISPAVAGVIFLLLFNPTGGIINYFLGQLGLGGIQWLNNPTYAPWAVILASVWKSLGFNILFYIAGLQNVPNELKEAAAIDGANLWQRFIRITWPMLSPITFFLLITNTTYAVFETFGTIEYLTPGGGPLQSTETLMYRVFRVGIKENDLGAGAAQSIILFLLVIGLTVIQFRSTGRRVNYGG